MTFVDILKLPKAQFQCRPVAFLLVCLFVVGATIYPSRLDQAQLIPLSNNQLKSAHFTEQVLRHVNWILPIALALALRDVNGIKQIAVISVAGVAATHIPKRLLNDVEIMGTRLGQRPWSHSSRHNMPSGHSALSSAGAFFLARRYSLWLALVGIPILFLTMYARVILDAHTVSATLAGAGIGVMVTAMFCTKMPQSQRRKLQNLFGRNR